MEAQKTNWTSAHAQLWSSFKKAQNKNDSNKHTTNVTRDTVTPVDSMVGQQHTMIGSDMTFSILDEVTKRTRLDQPVFSDELEGHIIALIEDSTTDSSVRNLLTTIIHLKNRVERVSSEAVYRKDSLIQVVDESLLHLSGQKSAPILLDEMGAEGNEAMGIIESRFFAILIQIEKCKKAMKGFLENNGMGKMISSESSLREMLDMFFSSSNLSVSKREEPDNGTDTVLHQVMDILGSPPGTRVDQVPDLALKAMKELESLRRENNTNSMLLLQYERTVMAKFASCGFISPTVEQEKTALLSKSDISSSNSNDPWIMNDMRDLVHDMTEVSKNCQLNIIPNWLIRGHTEKSAGSILKYMRSSIEGARVLLMVLSNDLTKGKESLLRILPKLLNRGTRTHTEINLSSVNEKPFTDILHELERIVQSQENEEQYTREEVAGLENQSKKTIDVMMKIARWLPENDQININEVINNEVSFYNYVEDAVKHLATVSREQDSMLSEIRKLTSQIVDFASKAEDGITNIFDENALSSLISTSEELRKWAMKRNESNSEDATIQESLYELAQLLPTGLTPSCAVSGVRIDPPVNNILDMVQLLKIRLQQWIQEQQKQQLSGAHSRLEKSRVEEVVRERSKQLVKITKEILLGGGGSSEMEDVLGVLSAELAEGPTAVGNNNGSTGGGGGGGGPQSSVIATVFDDLEERLKLVKVRHHRLFNAYTADKVRLDNLIQSCNTHNKRFSRICIHTGAICRAVGLEQIANRLERDSKKDSVSSSSSKPMLLQEQKKTNVVQPVNDVDIIEVLKLIEERLEDNESIRDNAQQKSELLHLKEKERRWREETDTFRQAMQVILVRLAEAGRRLKCTLFVLGTDESSEDDAVESVIREEWKRPGQDDDTTEEEKEQHRLQEQGACEDLLAVLLQKFGRWTTRLQEAAEDHLYTQKKLNKYFADVHRFFCPSVDPSSLPDVTDENLIDIDTLLLRFADGILLVLDRTIGEAKSSFSGNRNTGENTKEGGGGGADADADDVRSKAISIMLKDVPTKHVPQMDHRLVRLYESIGKLRTMVDGLLSVRYLSIPSGSRRRGGDAPDELTFDDAWGDSYVELDLNKLKDPPSTGTGNDGDLTLSDDLLFRTVENNIRSVHQALSRFSTNYKLAVILVQKDIDMMQQFIASMLEPYAELDVERVFNQDPVVLKEMHALLNERATRQRGCYFFNRIGGEGPCLWATTLEQLSIGFVGILDKLRKRTQVAMELRDIVDDVVDLCAFYVNWVEMSGGATLSLHPLPPDVLEACVREDDEAEVEENPELTKQSQQQQQPKSEKKVPKPPLPPNHPRSKISHFVEDTVVLKVISHMFQLAQEAASSGEEKNEKNGDKEKKDSEDDASVREAERRRQEEELHQLEEQLQLMRESAAVAEQRANLALEDCKRIEQAREKALSEAAISRSELRRWKRAYGIPEDELPPSSQQQLKEHPHPHQKHQVPHSTNSLETAATTVAVSGQHAPHTLQEMEPSSSATGYPMKDNLLLQIAYSMKELTEELRGACQRSGIVPPQVAMETNKRREEGHPDVPLKASGNLDDRTSKRNPQGKTSPRSSGLVRSPKEVTGVAPRRGSISPKSESSPPRAPITYGSSSSPATDTYPHKLSGQHRVVDGRGEGSGLAPCVSVVVAPKRPTYSSLARSHSNAASATTRVPSAIRYKPSSHRGEFFNECDVCCRHHRSNRFTKCATTPSPLTARRSDSRLHRALRPSSLTSSREASPPLSRQLQHEDAKMTTCHYHHHDGRSSSTRRLTQRSSLSPSSERVPRQSSTSSSSAMRYFSEVREQPAATAFPSFSNAIHNEYDHHYPHRHGKPNHTRRSESLLSPSTSTVLSPESPISPADAGMDQYQQPYNYRQHQQQHPHHHQRVKGQHTSPTMLSRANPESTGRRPKEQQQAQQQQQPNSSVSQLRKKTPQSANLRTDAVRKLADIVARTKVSGTEQF